MDSKNTILHFTKMHGAGNDYIYINGFKQDLKNHDCIAKVVSDRHFGVGGDGIVEISRSDVADARMRMFNADGSEGEMCGNAIRCVAKYVYDNDICKKETLSIETLAGIKKIELSLDFSGLVSHAKVDMGIASLKSQDIPVLTNEDTFISKKITILDTEYTGTCVSMGNPHFVVFVNSTNDLDLPKIGPHFENNSIFPKRINTEFVEFIDKNTVSMRVWERGSGETLACGTGACATVVACIKNNLLDFDTDITVKLLGGELVIRVTPEYRVYMSGPATKVFDGTIELDI